MIFHLKLLEQIEIFYLKAAIYALHWQGSLRWLGVSAGVIFGAAGEIRLDDKGTLGYVPERKQS